MKICPKCETEKERSCFHKNKSKVDGLQSICKSCRSTAKFVDTEVSKGVNKRCLGCLQIKALSEFHKDGNSRHSNCKVCVSSKRKLKTAASKVLYGDEHLLEAGINKRCSVCKTIKTLDNFTTLRKATDGKNCRCVDCTRDWYIQHKELHSELNREWRKENRSRVRVIREKRRANKLKAIPPWLTAEDQESIRQIFHQALRLSEITGEKYHVDHLVPLQGESVCGLHVPWNMLPMKATENLSKRNKLFLHESLAFTVYNEDIWLTLQKGYNELH